MTTRFFLYTKQDGYSVQDITGCQILNPASYAGTILLYPEESIDNHYNNAILEGSLIEWCKEFCSKDGIFLDIGAHTGSYAVCLSPNCKEVYAFEPCRRNYYGLCGSVALSNRQNIQCFQLAIGSPEQLNGGVLYIKNENGEDSSLHNNEPEKVIRTEEVDIITLDTFFNNKPIDSAIQFIKIDVEGNELEVLQGAVDTLKQHNYPKIVFERNSDESKQKRLLDFLNNDLGYYTQPITGYAHMYLATR